MMKCIMCGIMFKEGIEYEEEFRAHLMEKHLDEVLDSAVDLYTIVVD